ncbi:MAG: hypothetical protein HC914_20785, partial [Chloroflexaceae bacterium]|nr:hypothetical protein [Chloroflexaceae bacterium]
MTQTDIYATPQVVTDLNDCIYYHTMDIPGYGEVEGYYDLRGAERAYMGGVQVAGKRVLEVGTASGYMGMYMERQGAEVIGYDLSGDYAWDTVPYARLDYPACVLRTRHYPQLNMATGSRTARISRVCGWCMARCTISR